MRLSAYEGFVEGGRIRLREDVALPENATVFVLVTGPPPEPALHLRSPRLAEPERWREFEKVVSREDRDASV